MTDTSTIWIVQTISIGLVNGDTSASIPCADEDTALALKAAFEAAVPNNGDYTLNVFSNGVSSFPLTAEQLKVPTDPKIVANTFSSVVYSLPLKLSQLDKLVSTLGKGAGINMNWLEVD
jgi:hypothetical protein